MFEIYNTQFQDVINPIKYLSIFSGIGGFEYGIQQSNKEFECIGYSEVDKFAKSIYRKHFPGHKDLGDATKIRTEELADFDLLVGGFPCQAFSMAGYRKGFDDTRGTLFFELARILKDKRPKYFLFENVKGLLSHDKGKTFQTILEVLSDLGYDVEWCVLNSKNYGVPQNRERVYIKGHFRGGCGGEVLSLRKAGGEFDEKVKFLKNGRQTFTSNAKIIKVGNSSQTNYGGGSIVHENGISGTLSATNFKHPITVSREKIISLNGAQQGQRVYDPDGLSVTLCGNGGGQGGKTGLYSVSRDTNKIRRLTPLECERLQGFPDYWTEDGVDGEKISDTQRYKCCGNAVTTTVITHIINNWKLVNENT